MDGLNGVWLTVGMIISIASTVSINIFILYDIVIQSTIRKAPTKLDEDCCHLECEAV